MPVCNLCGEDVIPIGYTVCCEYCGAEYSCESLEEDTKNVTVDYSATQTQPTVYSYNELQQLKAEEQEVLRVNRWRKFELTVRHAVKCLRDMNIVELPNDFEEKVLMFCMSIDDKFGEKRGYSGAQAREGEGDTENDEMENQGSNVKKSNKENILTMSNVIVILWLVLRRDTEHNLPILMSDLVRWFRELHIFVPEPNLVSGPTSYTIHGRSRLFFCSAYLNVHVLSPLDVRAIIKRTLIDLELPGTFGKYVWGYYRKHYRQPANEVVPPRPTKGMVEQELRLAASFLAVMKLFWGLNDYCEKDLDSLAKTLNQIYRDDNRWQPLFEFQEWIEYLEWRSSVLKAVYHPAQIRDEKFATATDASPFYHYQKMYKKKLAEFQGWLTLNKEHTNNLQFPLGRNF